MGFTARGKVLAAVAALVVCAWVSPAPASAATILVDGDDVVADDACGTEANPCNTILAGVTAAQAGDTIAVGAAAQPYAEAVEIATPDISLLGPQAGVAGADRERLPEAAREAVIDAPDDALAAIAVLAAGVRVEGFHFAGKAALAGDSFPAVNLAAPEAEVRNNVMVDHVPGVRLTGTGHLVSRNLFVQTTSAAGFHGVIADAPTADVAIRQNRFEDGGVAISVGGAGSHSGIAIEGNTLLGGPEALGIDLVALTASKVRGNHLEGHATGIAAKAAKGLQIDGNTIAGAGKIGIALTRDVPGPGSEGVVIVRNQLLRNGAAAYESSAGVHVAPDALAGELRVVANRFAGQDEAGVPGLVVGAQGPGWAVRAADNWWGCSAGPGAPGCDAVRSAPGATTAAPWLVFGAAANPGVTTAPGSVRLSAVIQRNSAGQEVPEVAPLGPLPFEFTHLAGDGTVSERASLGGGAAQATLASPSPGRTTVRAALDSAAADVVVDFAGPPPPAVAAKDTTAPWLRNLQARRSARATTLRYVLSEDGVVALHLDVVKPGRRAGRRCVARKAGRRGRWCARRLPLGSLSRAGAPGTNEWRLPARLGKRRLGPGTYRATVTMTDAAGNTAPAKRISFAIPR